jgi:hypothetical protein
VKNISVEENKTKKKTSVDVTQSDVLNIFELCLRRGLAWPGLKSTSKISRLQKKVYFKFLNFVKK